MAHFAFAVKPSSLGSAARSRFPKSCSTGSVAYGAATSSPAALSPLASPFASPLASPFASPLASPRASSLAASAAAAGFNSPLPSAAALPLVSSPMRPSAYNYTHYSLNHHGDDPAVYEHDSLKASSVKSHDRMRPPTLPVAAGENVCVVKQELFPTKPSSQAGGDSGATPTEAAFIEYNSGSEFPGDNSDEFIVRRRFEVMPFDNDDEDYNEEKMFSQARIEAARLVVLGSRRGSVHIQRESAHAYADPAVPCVQRS